MGVHLISGIAQYGISTKIDTVQINDVIRQNESFNNSSTNSL